jgi:serine/threonine-protein kinase
MGELYLARSANTEGFEKLVALKRIVAVDGNREQLTRALLDEAQLMAALHHPNIAQVYDAGRHEGDAFYTMEYVNGRSVRDIVSTLAKRGRGMTLGNALWIAQCTAAALQYAHDKRSPEGASLGIVHRDVCPSNIMVTLDGTVKLIDFGIAKAVSKRANTTPGTVKGNLRYMSPEQYLGMALDGRSDLFSLGIVLFELTTGTRWLRERDDVKAAQEMLHGEYPRPSERRAGYLPALEEIVMTALRRDRNARQRDARTLQRQLDELVRTERLESSSIGMAELMQDLFSDAKAASTQRALAESPVVSPHTAPLGAADPVKAIPAGTVRLPEAAAPVAPAIAPEAAAPLPAPGAGQTLPLSPESTSRAPDAASRETSEVTLRSSARAWLYVLLAVAAMAALAKAAGLI